MPNLRVLFVSLAVWLSIAISTALPASAKTLVLVQGYLGNVASYRQSAITDILKIKGWTDGGHLVALPQGVAGLYKVEGAKRFYTLELPTEAPTTVQAGILASYVRNISEMYAEEDLILVGHSAGGVVSRLMLVQYPDIEVETLITIASPHLGTELAEDGLTLANSPVGFFAPMFGAGTLNRSQALYADLVRERPGTLLGWLNRQTHPDIRYVSLVRGDPRNPANNGDDIVPGWSQDLNNVVALKGKATTYLTPAAHELTAGDGAMIAGLLAE